MFLGDYADHQYLCFCRYYEGGVSSVYFWDLDDGFAGVVLLKKSKFPMIYHVFLIQTS